MCYNNDSILSEDVYPRSGFLAKSLKEGCHMIYSNIKSLFINFKFDGFTINIGPVGFNFTRSPR